jgi:putative ABC transport system permease protein
MLFLPLKDAQETQFLKDNDAIINDRARTAANPAFNRPGSPALLDAVQNLQTSSRRVNAVLVQLAPGFTPEQVAEPMRRWKHLSVYTREGMENILIVKLIANSAKQIGMFLVILAIVSAAIVAFIIYTMTMGKLREIEVLKLIGTRDRTIASMILQQALGLGLGLGLIGFAVGKVAATLWAPAFPKFVLLLPGDAATGLVVTLVICALANTMAIRVALKVDPGAERSDECDEHTLSRRYLDRWSAQGLWSRRYGCGGA